MFFIIGPERISLGADDGIGKEILEPDRVFFRDLRHDVPDRPVPQRPALLFNDIREVIKAVKLLAQVGVAVGAVETPELRHGFPVLVLPAHFF